MVGAVGSGGFGGGDGLGTGGLASAFFRFAGGRGSFFFFPVGALAAALLTIACKSTCCVLLGCTCSAFGFGGNCWLLWSPPSQGGLLTVCVGLAR